MKHYLNAISSLYVFTFRNISKITLICLPIILGSIAASTSNFLATEIGFILFALLTALYSIKAIYGTHRLYLKRDLGDYHIFKWTRSEFQFFGKTILIALIGIILTLISMLITTPLLASTLHSFSWGFLILTTGIYFIICFCVSLFLLRYTLYFPAKAIDSYISFSESAEFMQGKLIKYTLFLFAATVPLILMDRGVELLMSAMKFIPVLGMLVRPLYIIYTAISLSATIAIYASSLSFVYKEVLGDASKKTDDNQNAEQEFSA